MKWRHYLETAFKTVSNAAKTVSTGVIVAPEAIKWNEIANEFRQGSSKAIRLGPGDQKDVATRGESHASIYTAGRHM